VEQIAACEAAALGISNELATEYLRDTLHFTLGPDEWAGLRRFYALCVAHELAPRGLERALQEMVEWGVCRR
jgi:predicted solute-binding protein